MNREAVYIPESKTKIENIKRKYKNLQMSDANAKKIIPLEATNKILKLATSAVGIITVIDFIVPDPVLGLDEIALASITGLLKYTSSVVDNKIDELAKNGNADVQMSEITKLSEQLGKTINSVKNSRGINR